VCSIDVERENPIFKKNNNNLSHTWILLPTVAFDPRWSPLLFDERSTVNLLWSNDEQRTVRMEAMVNQRYQQ
jgi:hypothetical protein